MIKPSVVLLSVVLAAATTAVAQQPLSVDESVVRDVAAGTTHAYTIQLNTGDFIAGYVEATRYRRRVGISPRRLEDSDVQRTAHRQARIRTRRRRCGNVPNRCVGTDDEGSRSTRRAAE